MAVVATIEGDKPTFLLRQVPINELMDVSVEKRISICKFATSNYLTNAYKEWCDNDRAGREKQEKDEAENKKFQQALDALKAELPRPRKQ